MSFSVVKNVRIKSLTPNAVVQLRFGKAAVRSTDDAIVSAKLLRHYTEGEKSLVVFEEFDRSGGRTEITISRFPGAPWRSGSQYVSLVAVDESTFAVVRPPSPIQTDVIGEAIKLIEAEKEDVYGYEQLIALLTQIQTGRRINAEVKALATKFASSLVKELSELPTKEPTG